MGNGIFSRETPPNDSGQTSLGQQAGKRLTASGHVAPRGQAAATVAGQGGENVCVGRGWVYSLAPLMISN